MCKLWRARLDCSKFICRPIIAKPAWCKTPCTSQKIMYTFFLRWAPTLSRVSKLLSLLLFFFCYLYHKLYVPSGKNDMWHKPWALAVSSVSKASFFALIVSYFSWQSESTSNLFTISQISCWYKAIQVSNECMKCMVTANNKRANLDQSTCLTGEGLRATHLDIKCLTVEWLESSFRCNQ